jgi:endogenous inhibitor of DNA gyrase (YacG/DUF329 family)
VNEEPASPACLICGRAVVDRATAPFCGARCRDLDLGRWLNGSYRMPGPPVTPPTATPGTEGGDGSADDAPSS